MLREKFSSLNVGVCIYVTFCILCGILNIYLELSDVTNTSSCPSWECLVGQVAKWLPWLLLYVTRVIPSNTIVWKNSANSFLLKCFEFLFFCQLYGLTNVLWQNILLKISFRVILYESSQVRKGPSTCQTLLGGTGTY